MAQVLASAGYSIAAVSKLTGISCHALRVWERRYGFPIPCRSASGHRRYASEQVGVLREIAVRTRAGDSIGELIDDYHAGRLPLATLEQRDLGESSARIVVDLLFAGDLAGAEAVLDRFQNELSPLELVEQTIEPALIEIGERWFRRESCLYQERAAMGCLFSLIHRLLHRVRHANTQPKRRVLIGAVQGDVHEGGIMLLSLALELAGWRAISVGVDVPIGEFPKAIDAWKPDALALSFVLSRNIKKRFGELAGITAVPVFVGGRSIVNHQGLARRFGMIPLAGSLSATSAQLILETERWHGRQARSGSSRNVSRPGDELAAPASWEALIGGDA